MHTHVFMCSLCIWGKDAWDSSVHWVLHQSTPTLKAVERHQMAPGGGVSLFLILCNPQGYRQGEMSKAATCHISFQHSTVSCHESLSGLDSSPGRHCIHTTQSFFLILGTEVSCGCLHSCQTGWTHTHDGFTLMCGFQCVCGLRHGQVFSRTRHQGYNLWYLTQSSQKHL